ncbi:hypothetical protein BC827DRAFT_554734 [Russula dissimulans]|nr:hypothetical protein BC827DRAFT_554734 [Russula dissimulans]
MQFTAATRIRLTDRDLMLEGRQINLWALHRMVFLRNGYEAVTATNEWPTIGAALGFPSFGSGDASQSPRCTPAVSHRLQQLYHDVLRPFDQAYIASVIARLKNSQAAGQIPPQPTQPQAQPHQPTESDYQALLDSVTSEPSVMNSEAMSILPRFSHTSGADLEAHRVPQHVIAFVEQNREHLQRTAQDQNGFRIALTSKNQPFDNRPQINQPSALQGLPRPPQLIPGSQGLQHLQRQVLAQGPGKPTTLPASQLFNPSVGPLARPSTAQSMNASGMTPIGAQIAGPSSSGGAQGPGAMSVPMHPIAINGVGAVQVRRPSNEELNAAKRWVDEQKRKAFSRGKSDLLVLQLSNSFPL